MSWKRSENVGFPQIWHTFEAKDPDSGQSVKYRVQDLPEDRYDEVLDLMKYIFLKEEILAVAFDHHTDPRERKMDFWSNVLNKKLSVVCFKEGSDEICGFNILEVIQKEDKPKELPDQKVLDITKVLNFVKEKSDIFNRYGVEEYLYGVGLLIIPKYRGLGLSTEILRARIPLGKALGFKVTSTAFTGTASQKAASRAGFIEDFSILYGDLANKEPFVTVPNVASETLKFMSLRIE
uniref:N-acetyltransferase domain-containing protein n=1 Tax=Nyssomyia neivai TaxID=330878 RepID=A0A1L8DAG3_9DIPT